MSVQPFLPGLESEQRSAALSQWYSPPVLAQKLWDWAPKRRTGGPFRVLEPAAGKGALILPMLKGNICPTEIVAYDVDPVNIEALICLAARTTNVEIIVKGRDLLADPEPGYFDLVLQNPPFENGQAAAFINRALDCAPLTVGIFPASLPYSQGRWKSLWSNVNLRRGAFLERERFGGDHSPMTDFMVCELERRARPRAKHEPMTLNMEWW